MIACYAQLLDLYLLIIFKQPTGKCFLVKDLLLLVLRMTLQNDVYATYRVIIVKVGVKLGQQVRAPVKVRDVSWDPEP